MTGIRQDWTNDMNNVKDQFAPKPNIQNYFLSPNFFLKGVLGYIAYVVIFPTWLAALIHKWRGVKIDRYKTVYIAPNVLIDTSYPERVKIGNFVYIKRGAKVIAHTSYTPMAQEFTKAECEIGNVVIDDGAYIGVNAVVLPNVKIGKCAVIGAGAVVTKDIPDYAIAAGCPAKVIGDIRKNLEQGVINA